MKDFWTGVTCSFMITVCLALIFMAVCMEKVNRMEERMAELEESQRHLEYWYKENETVMQTYKFFNQSWKAIIDMQEKEADNEQ